MTEELQFTHLHTHSHYSLLNALPKINELIDKAKEYGLTSLAITEDGNMYSAIDFYKACKDAEIKPIIGVDMYVAPRSMKDKENKTDDSYSRLVLLAKNKTGYLNLIKLVTDANLFGFYKRPRTDIDSLNKYRDGLLAILPADNSSVRQALNIGDKDTAVNKLLQYKSIYGDDLYIEITHHPELLGHEDKMSELKDLANTNQIPTVAAHNVYYLKKEDALARKLANKIRDAEQLTDDEMEIQEDYSFISKEQIQKLFKNDLESLQNVDKIINKCNLELDLGNWTFPSFPIPEGETFNNVLRTEVFKGLEKKKINKSKEVLERIEYELDVIKTKGYSPYFLVVSDLMRWAAANHILTNTRGSAAGSFVSYLIDITSINPLDYSLPFERFLNPERPSPPDIDMDIPDNKRDAMINYARSKYGESAVAQIGTFGTMAARAVVRDVARALGYPYGLGDKIAKLIPFGAQGFPMTIDKAMELEPELKKAYKTMHDVREIIDFAKQLEGNARHVGVHAAGVVISDTKNVTDYIPVQYDPKGTGKLITQYDMHGVEDAGLLKYDFLGLKNLAILADAVRRVKKLQGIELDVNHLDLDNKKVFDMLSTGHTGGVFQLSSSGMTKWLMELRPTTIHDINAMVALYRPGPMEFIPDYIERKRDPSKIRYVDPRLEKYLAPTFGILIYQDDVMLIAVELAGYSWGEADKFRKAMGKKIPEEMDRQHDKFINGCVERGMKKEAALKLWDMIKTFAAYGFNKAHAVSYGNLAYKTAYLKANYPLEYMAALLTADSGDVDRIFETVQECKKMGIDVLPPSINDSLGVFSVVVDSPSPAIRFGLNSIKNFGEGIATSIVKERKENGPYKSLSDFLIRVSDSNLNKRSLEALIKSGALDEFGERNLLLSNLDTMLQYHKEEHSKPENQDSLFGMTDTQDSEIQLNPVKEMALGEKLMYEKELLGLYVSGHPLDEHKDKLKGRKDIATTKASQYAGVTTVIAGLIENVHTILTQKGDKMAFVRIADYSDTVELVVFPRVFEKYNKLIREETCIMVKGKISKKDGEINFMAEAFKEL